MHRVLAIAGYSGSGKTTLIEALLPELAQLGWRVNVIKHSHHDIEFEPPHKDTARFRAAGAGEVMLVSPYRVAIFQELAGREMPRLSEQIARFAPADLCLVEGFKREPIAKIEVWRAVNGKPPLFVDDEQVIAIATDSAAALPPHQLPLLDLNHPAAIAQFIFQYFSDLSHA
ncbi:molybdopterin-guanine dinucleotide biosynthesis protein B [Chitinibacter bivalviorum]|uniref:Molybdopterin-guanine dinucleotide biosynthesis protein B n=1 Tax=Chitinibacter bivalviorum TaxID=2739434 RepID=A0A7H9BN87_9NEIS|nr:molybdopterin-guanine dinucleotide biosynthesis protein B [Chitinibacter bivalviorum]QLG88854.1 molybdopterin-guanine dinucleotide biosynthesis protein B [Chitinibacter bivalviorum]